MSVYQYFYTPRITNPNHNFDFSNEVSAFFTHYQEPCAILTATSLLCLLKFSKYHRVEDKGRLARFLVQLSQVCFITSFMLAICGIVVSMIAQGNILLKRFDPVATNVYNVLMREFEFEFTAIRWSFLVSTLSLFVGLICTVLLGNDLFYQDKMGEKTLVMMALFSIMSGILSYINTNLFSWDNIFNMTGKLIKVSRIY